MHCKITSYMVSSGSARTITVCETHNWTFEGPVMEMCPIGRIELATDDAIRRIHGHAALALDEVTNARTK